MPPTLQAILTKLDIIDSKLDGHLDHTCDVIESKYAQNIAQLNKRFDQVNKRVDEVNKLFVQVERRFDTLGSLLKNRRITYIRQPIFPLPAFDYHGNVQPLPPEFPECALYLYYLQKRKNWPKLITLLEYYGLSADVTGGDNLYVSYTGQSLTDAVASDPKFAVIVLASHLGVDWDSFEQLFKWYEARENDKRNREIPKGQGRDKPV